MSRTPPPGRWRCEVLRDSTRNLLTYEAAAGVGTSRCVIGCGTERLSESGYSRQNRSREADQNSAIPYSIVHATQFFEFPSSSPTLPLYAARCLPPAFPADGCRRCRECRKQDRAGPPVNGTVEIGGPKQFRLTNWSGRDWPHSKILATSSLDPEALLLWGEGELQNTVPDKTARLAEPL
jgi:hypothetical protein